MARGRCKLNDFLAGFVFQKRAAGGSEERLLLIINGYSWFLTKASCSPSATNLQGRLDSTPTMNFHALLISNFSYEKSVMKPS